jgi:hypothetical protein
MHSVAMIQELQIQQWQHVQGQELVQEEHDQHMIARVLVEEEAAPHEIVLLDWDQVDHSRSAASRTTKK